MEYSFSILVGDQKVISVDSNIIILKVTTNKKSRLMKVSAGGSAQII